MHVFRRIEHDARADPVRRILHHRHEEPQRAERRNARRRQHREDAPLPGEQPSGARQRRNRAEEHAEHRAEQVAHAHARHAQRQQRPLPFIPAEHLVQPQHHHREKDHRQAFAQRRARVHVHQPIDAQRIEHARADGDAAAVHHAAHAQVARNRRRQMDAGLEHPNARAQGHAQIAQQRREIEEQLGVKFRRGIAVAQQRRAVDAHGELPVSQPVCDALDAVEVEEQVVPVVNAAPEQRHAGKRRRAEHHRHIPAVFAAALGLIPREHEQRRQHRADERRVSAQIGGKHARADLMHRNGADRLRVFARQIEIRRGIRQPEDEAQPMQKDVLRLRLVVRVAVFDERLIPGGNDVRIHARRVFVFNRRLIVAPHQVQAAVFALRGQEIVFPFVFAAPEPRVGARLRVLLRQRHRLVSLLLPRVGLLAGDDDLRQLVALVAPRILVPVRIDQRQREQRRPQQHQAQNLFSHIVKPPNRPFSHKPP